MADVNVTVAVDGKAVFSAGAVGAPDATQAVLMELGLALAHFQAVKAAATPAPAGPVGLQGQAAVGQLPKDNSL